MNPRAYDTAGRAPRAMRPGACIMQYCSTEQRKSDTAPEQLLAGCCMLSDLRISGSAGQASAAKKILNLRSIDRSASHTAMHPQPYEPITA